MAQTGVGDQVELVVTNSTFVSRRHRLLLVRHVISFILAVYWVVFFFPVFLFFGSIICFRSSLLGHTIWKIVRFSIQMSFHIGLFQAFHPSFSVVLKYIGANRLHDALTGSWAHASPRRHGHCKPHLLRQSTHSLLPSPDKK